MRKLICIAVLCLICLTPSSHAQNPFEPWLKQVQLSGVPFTDGAKVVPGAFYQVGAVGPYYGAPTSEGTNAPLTVSTLPVGSQKIEIRKAKNLFASMFSLSSKNSVELVIDPTEVTCVGIDAGGGGPLDHLVYEDPQTKLRLRDALTRNGIGMIVEQVCYASYFKLTQESSREFLVSANKGPIPDCTDTEDGAKSAKSLASTATVGDLISKLKNPILNIPVAFSACKTMNQSVTLKSNRPVAIGMKVWNVWKCGPQQRNACTLDTTDDPNGLEFDQASYPSLY